MVRVLGKLIAHVILDDQQLKSIGTLAVESAFIENNIESMIWFLCDLTTINGRIITTSMQLSARLDLLQTLIKSRVDQKIQGEFALIASDLRIAIEERNTIIHGLWLPDLTADRTTPIVPGKNNPKASRRIKSSDTLKTIGVDRLDSVVEAFDSCGDRIGKFMTSYFRWNTT